MMARIRGTEIYYEQHGDGHDVLFLHGWGCNCETMAILTQHVQTYGRVTTLDFPGFGKSARLDENGWGVGDYMEMLLVFMDEIGLEKPDIIAHSFGARVAIRLSAAHPERVGKMIFTGAAGLIKKRTMRYYTRTYAYKLGKRIMRVSWLKKACKGIGIDVEKRVKSAGSPDYRALDDAMKKTFVRVVNEDLRPYLGKIQSPVLLIWGENDMETPLYFAQIMAKEIPDAGLCVLNGCGHYAFLEQSVAFIRIMDAFWRETA